MDSLPKITKDKILQNTINSTESYDVAEGYKFLPKLRVGVYPQLEQVDFYDGRDIPKNDYVPASSQTRSKRQKHVKKSCKEHCELSDLLNNFEQGQLTFIGQAGSGKSTLLNAIAREVIDGKYKNLKDVDIVHRIQCQDFRQGSKVTLSELLFQNMNPRLSGEEIRQTLEYAVTNPKRILFILDSLDTLSYTIDGKYEQLRVTDRASPEAVLWNFLAGKLIPGCRIITSSREYSIRNYMGEVRAHKVIALVGLSKDSIRKIIVGYVGENEAEEIMQYMEHKSPTLLELTATPVLLMYSLIGIKYGGDFKPSNISGILISLLNSLIRSPHTHEKNIFKVINKLQELSFTGTNERRVLFSTEDFARLGLEPKAATDLVTQAPGGLTQRLLLGSDLVCFAHQSIQELLTAMYIAQMPRESFLNFLSDNIHTAHYAVVRRILCGLLLDDEVKDQAGQYFCRNLNVEENQDLLRQSLQEQLSRKMTDRADTLELYLSLFEAKNGMKEAINSSVKEIDLKKIPLLLSDAHAVGWVASNCKQLSKLSLENCHLKSTSVNALVLNLRDCDLKISVLQLSSNIHMDAACLKSVGEISKQSKVEKLQLADCNLSPQQLEALKSGLSFAKLSTLDLEWNTTMGEEGLKTVGEILKQCRAKEINLEDCKLSAQELQALQEGLNSTKLSTLRLWKNTAMGEEGLKTVGEISKQCGLEELYLEDCKLSSQELQSLKEGLESAKIRKLSLWLGNQAASQEDILVLSELIQNVTELLDLRGWMIHKEDMDYLQQQCRRCHQTQLTIQIDHDDPFTNPQIQMKQRQATEEEQGKIKEIEEEDEAVGDKPDDLSQLLKQCATQNHEHIKQLADEFAENSNFAFAAALYRLGWEKILTERDSGSITKVIHKSGGVITLDGCTIDFPDGAVKDHTEINMAVSMGSPTNKKGLIPITPVVELTPCMSLQTKASVKLPTWCRKADKGRVDVYYKQRAHSTWTYVQTVVLDDDETNAIEFEIDKFCEYCAFITLEQLGESEFAVLSNLYYNIHGELSNHVFVNCPTVEDRVEKKMASMQCVSGCTKILVIYVKANDKIKLRLQSESTGQNFMGTFRIDDDFLKNVSTEESFLMPVDFEGVADFLHVVNVIPQAQNNTREVCRHTDRLVFIKPKRNISANILAMDGAHINMPRAPDA